MYLETDDESSGPRWGGGRRPCPVCRKIREDAEQMRRCYSSMGELSRRLLSRQVHYALFPASERAMMACIAMQDRDILMAHGLVPYVGMRDSRPELTPLPYTIWTRHVQDSVHTPVISGILTEPTGQRGGMVFGWNDFSVNHLWGLLGKFGHYDLMRLPARIEQREE